MILFVITHEMSVISTRTFNEMGFANYYRLKFGEAFSQWSTQLEECITYSPQKNQPDSPNVGLSNVRKVFLYSISGLMISLVILFWEILTEDDEKRKIRRGFLAKRRSEERRKQKRVTRRNRRVVPVESPVIKSNQK